jgi:hypothetical protein
MATNHSGGMYHPTVVPENFDPDEDTEESDDGPARSLTGA